MLVSVCKRDPQRCHVFRVSVSFGFMATVYCLLINLDCWRRLQSLRSLTIQGASNINVTDVSFPLAFDTILHEDNYLENYRQLQTDIKKMFRSVTFITEILISKCYDAVLMYFGLRDLPSY